MASSRHLAHVYSFFWLFWLQIAAASYASELQLLEYKERCNHIEHEYVNQTSAKPIVAQTYRHPITVVNAKLPLINVVTLFDVT